MVRKSGVGGHGKPSGRSTALHIMAWIICLFLLCCPVWGQIRLVHATSCGTAMFPSSCTIPATAAGNLIVVVWAGYPGYGTSLVSGMTDNAGDVIVQAPNARSVNTDLNVSLDYWYVKNSRAGATSLTIAPNVTSQGAAMIWEFSGVDTTAPLDQVDVLNTQPSTSTPAGAPVTITSPNEVIVSSTLMSQTTGILAGNPFVVDSTLNGDGYAHLFTSSVGTYQAIWNDFVTVSNSSTVSFKAASAVTGGGGSALNACDLNADGIVNSVDVNLAVNMTLGQSACTASVVGPGVCTVVTVQRVVNAGLPGGSCVVSSQGTPSVSHAANLTWTASPSSNVSGYNVYRATAPGGPYTKLNSSPVSGLTYGDTAVAGGQTYYYVVTTVNTSGSESGYSTQATAVVPTP